MRSAIVIISALVASIVATVAPANAADEQIDISEFMAVNDSTLTDEDGEYPDWIELHNPGSAAVDLSGWSLTDDALDLGRWRFPSVTLPAVGYLVVFASSKDRAVAEGQLHTDFKLSSGGEYLAIVDPDGNITDEFAPAYPAQSADISYGRAGPASSMTSRRRDNPMAMQRWPESSSTHQAAPSRTRSRSPSIRARVAPA